MSILRYFDQKLPFFVYFLLLYFYVTILVVGQRNNFYIAPVLLFLLSIPYWGSFLYRSENQAVSVKPIVYAMLFYVVSECLMTWFHHDPIGGLKTTATVLLTIPIIFLIARAKLSIDKVLLIIALSAVVVGAVAVYDRFYLNLPRALVERHPIIIAGGVAMSMGMLCLCSMFFLLSQRKVKMAFLFLVAALCGILCSILTGSRGTWLCLPIVVLGLSWLYRRQLRLTATAVSIIFALLLTLALSLPQSGMMDRIQQGETDLSQYFDGKNKNGSLGLRLQFWESAAVGFVQKPLTGWGSSEGYRHMKEQQQQDGLITPSAVEEPGVKFTHAHNQFLDAAVKKGIIGLIALLGIVFLPLIYFVRLGKDADAPVQQYIAQLGIVHIFCAISYCMSDVFLGIKIGMVFYCITLATLLGISMVLQHKESV